jgi:hypothetical protein
MVNRSPHAKRGEYTGGKVGRKEKTKTALGNDSIGRGPPSLCTANTRVAKDGPDPADEETGPRLAKLGGAC